MLGEEGRDEAGRLLPPSRRPDGSLRKEVRIRAGYIPQDEVQRYVPKGTHPRSSGPRVPPGSDFAEALKVAEAKSKSAKKNEKRKVKKASEPSADVAETESGADSNGALLSVEKGMDALHVSADQKAKASDPRTSTPGAGEGKADLEKKLRALRKKLRQGESLSAAVASRSEQMTAEEVLKLSSLQDWQKEVIELEARLAICK